MPDMPDDDRCTNKLVVCCRILDSAAADLQARGGELDSCAADRLASEAVRVSDLASLVAALEGP